MHDATTTLARTATLDQYEADLLKLLNDAAAEIPHARNGRAVASDDPYADQVMKEIRGGRSKEVRRLVAVLLALLQRGAKRPAVRLFAQRLDAIIKRHGEDYTPRPIRILNRRETREDGMFDLAQLRLEADPDSIDALEGVVRQAAFYRCALDELIEEAHDRVVALRSRSHSPSETRDGGAVKPSGRGNLTLVEV